MIATAADTRLGLVGLGTMGANLARNLASHGTRLALFDTDAGRAAALAAEFSAGPGPGADAAFDLPALAALLPRPRAMLLLVPAGTPVDNALAALLPALDTGDAVIDGGNSFWRDTERRVATAAARGVDFLGFGISGGAEGARLGPAIMAGGASAALARVAPLFAAVAARHGATPCLVACGTGGSGHFIKMVHNGIEYAVMQALAEIYVLLRDQHGLTGDAIAAHWRNWQRGTAGSFLLECALRALAAREIDAPLLDAIADTASQKGTGSWTAIAALEFGVPTPTLAEAVFARSLSALRSERMAAAAQPSRPIDAATRPAASPEDLCDALIGAMISIHAQGFALIAAGAHAQGWSLDMAAIARAWRAGCIIRSALVERISDTLETAPNAVNLLRVPALAALAADVEPGWRRALAAATASALPVPVLGSALAYADGYRQARSGAHLIAAQRDIFGRHGFQRLDRPGSFHADWPRP
jgi:6-phosphogluconate dehydrogenase